MVTLHSIEISILLTSRRRRVSIEMGYSVRLLVSLFQESLKAERLKKSLLSGSYCLDEEQDFEGRGKGGRLVRF